MKLKDRVALITGGSTGIGRASAVAMAREGARVALTARRAERCQEAVEAIEALGGEALALPGDVANAEHVESLVVAAVERWGRLDIVVPNDCGPLSFVMKSVTASTNPRESSVLAPSPWSSFSTLPVSPPPPVCGRFTLSPTVGPRRRSFSALGGGVVSL